jgi:adenine/guanine phosphoribosyltransferase-like PRPP-binding protein
MFPFSTRTVRFSNRRKAGRVLATRLTAYADRSDVVILALPRGGVPVATEIAAALGAPLDVFVVRKPVFRFSRNSRWVPLPAGACASSTTT